MENKGQIEEISKKTSKNGGEFYKLKIAGHNYSVFDKTPAYDSLEAKEYKLNETVGFDYTETPGNFNGKPVTYKNIVAILKVAQPTTAPSAAPTETKAPDWDAKDRRIVRMASLNTAVKLVKTNFMALPDEVQKGGVSPALVMGIAKQFEEWVYRQEPKGDEE